MKVITLIFLLFWLTPTSFAQSTIIKFDRLEKILTSPSDKIQIVNFWATWCAPCVKELPIFEKIQTDHPDKIKVTLINLDYADRQGKVDAFIKRKNIKSEVLLLDEIDGNSWIDRVEKSWGGAIPATLVINVETGRRKFIEKELSEIELERMIAEVQ